MDIKAQAIDGAMKEAQRFLLERGSSLIMEASTNTHAQKVLEACQIYQENPENPNAWVELFKAIEAYENQSE